MTQAQTSGEKKATSGIRPCLQMQLPDNFSFSFKQTTIAVQRRTNRTVECVWRRWGVAFQSLHLFTNFSNLTGKSRSPIARSDTAGPNGSEHMHWPQLRRPMSSEEIYHKWTYTTTYNLAIKYTMLFQNRINFLQSDYKWISEIALP